MTEHLLFLSVFTCINGNNNIIIIVTSGQRILKKAASQGQIFQVWHCNVTLVGTIAVGCSSSACMPLLGIEWSFLLHTTQQRFPVLFSGPDNPRIAPCHGEISTPSITCFLGPAWVSPQMAPCTGSGAVMCHDSSVDFGTT